MTTIQTWCRRCGREFVADRASVVAGVWRLCPDCRGEPPRVPTEDPTTASRPPSVTTQRSARS